MSEISYTGKMKGGEKQDKGNPGAEAIVGEGERTPGHRNLKGWVP